MLAGAFAWRFGSVVTLAMLGSALTAASARAQLARARAFVVTDGSVRQGRFRAIAVSRDSIFSTYPRAVREVTIRIPVHIERDGAYAIDVRYANGSGPVNTEDKVAVRTLLVDADTVGVIVMPQRGVNRWTDWGWSNQLRTTMRAGPHTLTLTHAPGDANMNLRVSSALLDVVRLTPLAKSIGNPR